MQRNQSSLRVREREQIAAFEPPQAGRGILDCGLVPGCHQGAQIWQIGQQFCGAGECVFALILENLEGVHRIAQARKDFTANLFLNAVAYQEQGGTSEPEGNQQHGE